MQYAPTYPDTHSRHCPFAMLELLPPAAYVSPDVLRKDALRALAPIYIGIDVQGRALVAVGGRCEDLKSAIVSDNTKYLIKVFNIVSDDTKYLIQLSIIDRINNK